MSTRTNTHITGLFIILIFMLFFPGQVFGQDEEDEKKDRVWNVKIEGNDTFEDIVIKRYIANDEPSFWKKLTFFNRSGYEVSEIEIRKDVIRIERFYQRRGFDEVEVTYRLEPRIKDWRKDLYFVVHENMPIRIDSVEVLISATPRDSLLISESADFQRALRRLPYREGRRYETVEETEVIGRITQALNNLGYAYSSSEVEAVVDSTRKSASITLTNTPGPRTRFDSLIVEGENTLDEFYIRRETGIEQGEFFSQNKMREAQREVFKHHLFRLALISIPEQEQDTSLNVLLRVKELPLRSVQLRFGVGDFDRLTEPLGTGNFYKLFRTQASWTYRNVRGKGEQFSTSAKLSWYDQRLGFDYLFPYVYNTKSSITISPFFQNRLEEAYSIVQVGIINSFGYEYSRNLTASFSYEYALNNEYDLKLTENMTQTEVLPDSITSYNISSFSVNAYYTRGLQRGRRGLIVQPYLELSGLFGESTYSFQKLGLDARKYFPLTSELVFGTRARTGVIYYAKQDSLPSDILYYNGGTNSVRGWDRSFLGPKEPIFNDDGSFDRYIPAGGRMLFSFNVELRQNLDWLLKGFGLATFLDGGQVWSQLSDLDQRNLQYGVGGGIRYQSPIGPVRVDIAYKLNPTDADLNIYNGNDYGNRWSRWGLHFSIGQAF